MTGPQKNHIRLAELTQLLSQAVNTAPQLRERRVVAELAEVRFSGGHCYMDLVEKNPAGQIIAKMRANLWRGKYHALYNRYGDTLRELLQVGNEVLLQGSASFSPVYSLAFDVSDIDPTYRRDAGRVIEEILGRLRAENILEENKKLPMADAPQRIAVISAAGAAGYGDFMKQLMLNPYRLRFAPRLFAATMQGRNVSETVRAALNDIELHADSFDCVVIIRGGGATTDLDGFNDLLLARAVALSPLPVIVGIGHERDVTALDYIAHTRVKTPTAAAEFLVTRCAAVLAKVQELAASVASYAQKMVHGETQRLAMYEDQLPALARNSAARARTMLEKITASLPLLVQNRLLGASSQLDRASRAIRDTGSRAIQKAVLQLEGVNQTLRRETQVILARESQRLEALADKVRLLSPYNVLARGYSITRVDGHALRSAADAPAGTTLHTTLQQGTLTSTVN